MAVGDLPAWTDQTPGLAANMNKHGVVSGSAAYLSSLDLKQFKLLHCTSTGPGFTKDHVYLVTADGLGTIDLQSLTNFNHQHNGDFGGGGSYIHFYQGMAETVNSFDAHNLHLTDWTETTSGTGDVTEIENQSPYTDNQIFKYTTGATSASGANTRIGALQQSFEMESGFVAMMEFDQTTDTASHFGFQMETITSADDNLRKHGLVHCTSVNGNWFARTADGDSRSDADMGIAIDTNKHFITSIMIPDLSTVNTPHGVPFQNTFIDGDIAISKTNDIPIDGSGSRQNFWKCGLKNNVGTSKEMYLYKIHWTYTSAEWWGSSDLVA